MASLVANKETSYSSVLPATDFYPELKISEFQALFHFLEDETEAGILHCASVERIAIHRELKVLTTQYTALSAYSQTLFDDNVSALTLYKQAVFCKTAYALITNRLATDATKEAAGRQEALMQRADKQLTNYRAAIVSLLPDVSGYTFEMV
ncbi:head completion/stabilization protein [Psychromonas hadalis]|uniref:head completion/stabilization protein n=1 Tax=Psychromonas hadalis TaxID=211669 RepID=UPI0003B56B0F|nr:head completion/stabilization protein [Psychromonas hadalis]